MALGFTAVLRSGLSNSSMRTAKFQRNGRFSELNHNEIVGWEGAGEPANVSQQFSSATPTNQWKLTAELKSPKQLMEQAGVDMFEFQAQGKSTLAKMLSTICIGDFTSIYLAVLHGVDPTPVKTINFLKDTLKQNGVKEKIIGEFAKL